MTLNRLLLLISISLPLALLAQSGDRKVREDIHLKICNESSDEVRYERITVCNKLTAAGSDLEITSYLFSAGAGGKLYEERVQGNEFNANIVNYIRNKMPNIFYIEIIKLSDGTSIQPKKIRIKYN